MRGPGSPGPLLCTWHPERSLNAISLNAISLKGHSLNGCSLYDRSLYDRSHYGPYRVVMPQ